MCRLKLGKIVFLFLALACTTAQVACKVAEVAINGPNQKMADRAEPCAPGARRGAASVRSATSESAMRPRRVNSILQCNAY